jgi:hypothetical protein
MLNRLRGEHGHGRHTGHRKHLNRVCDHGPPRVGAELPSQYQGRDEHRRIGDAADHVMDLVVPGLAAETRADQQHVVTPEDSRDDGRRPCSQDQPRPGRPGLCHPSQPRAEPDCADT